MILATTIPLRRKGDTKSQIVTNRKTTTGNNSDPLLETLVDGRYFILRKIGEGGCGKVYRAIDRETGRDVAIKTIVDRLTTDEATVSRFIKEAALGKWIRHNNIVQVTDLSFESNPLYFVMEFLSGSTISEFIAKNGPLTWDQIKQVLIPVCEALAAVHAEGFVHRDVKPDNLFLLEDGTVKVLDLGLAISMEDIKANDGFVLGTPLYMAPEAIYQGSTIDHRVDVYGLGVTAYQMLTGELPFNGDSLEEIHRKHFFEEPEPPSIRKPSLKLPSHADTTILRAMAKKPEHRFHDVAEMGNAIATA